MYLQPYKEKHYLQGHIIRYNYFNTKKERTAEKKIKHKSKDIDLSNSSSLEWKLWSTKYLNYSDLFFFHSKLLLVFIITVCHLSKDLFWTCYLSAGNRTEIWAAGWLVQSCAKITGLWISVVLLWPSMSKGLCQCCLGSWRQRELSKRAILSFISSPRKEADFNQKTPTLLRDLRQPLPSLSHFQALHLA